MDSRRESANTNLDNDERSAFQRCVEIRRRLNCAAKRRRKQHGGSPNRLETIDAATEQDEPYAGISTEPRVYEQIRSTRRTAANDDYSGPIANAVAPRHFLRVRRDEAASLFPHGAGTSRYAVADLHSHAVALQQRECRRWPFLKLRNVLTL
jgi:hypothetical protein